MPIDPGNYVITNVKHGTLVFLPDPHHRTPLQGHFRRNISGEVWHVEERVRQRYSIQSVSHKSFATSGPRAQVEDSVEGDSKEQLWRIQECSEGKYTISTTDTRIFWALPQEELETPVELCNAHADRKCWWTFTKLGNDRQRSPDPSVANEPVPIVLLNIASSISRATDLRNPLKFISEALGKVIETAKSVDPLNEDWNTPLKRLQFHLDTIESQSVMLQEDFKINETPLSPDLTIISPLEAYASELNNIYQLLRDSKTADCSVVNNDTEGNPNSGIMAQKFLDMDGVFGKYMNALHHFAAQSIVQIKRELPHSDKESPEDAYYKPLKVPNVYGVQHAPCLHVLGAIEAHTNRYMETKAIAEDHEASLWPLREGIGTVMLKLTARAAPAVSPYHVVRKRERDIMFRDLVESKSSQQKVFAITGMGGCGKTQLVSWFLRENHPLFDYIVFVDASTEASIKADIQVWARSVADGHEHDVWEDGIRFLSIGRHNGRWALVLDNADDLNLKLVPFFPKCNNGTILITSRNRDVGNLVNTYHLEMGQMEAEEALSTLLLAARRQLPLTPEELKNAHTLVRQLGGLAVALVQAGTYCYQLSSVVQGVFQPYTFTQYLTLFSSERATLMKKEAPPSLDDYQRGVYTTLDLSYKAIPPYVRDFFHLIAQFHYSDISLAMLATAVKEGFKDPKTYLPRPPEHKVVVSDLYRTLCFDGVWSELKVQGMVQTLRSFSLISTTIIKNSLFLQLHPLVQAWARDMPLSNPQEYRTMAQQIITSCCIDNNIPLHRYLRPHIDAMLDATRRGDLHINDQLAAAKVLNTQGHYHDAEVLFSASRESLRHLCQKETEDTLSIAGFLAETYSNQGRWKEAETLRLEVLEKRREVLGLEHIDTIMAAGHLASSLHELGRWGEAEKLKLEVLEKRRRLLGAKHRDTIWAAASLAFTYHEQGRWDEAEKIECEALRQRRKILGTEDLDTLWTAAQLATTYREQGRLDEAEKLQLEVFDKRHRILGMEHPDTISAVGSLASTYHAQRRWAEAKKLRVEVLDKRRRILGMEHPDTITAAVNLAVTHVVQKGWEAAEELLAPAAEISLKLIGQQHPLTQECFRHLVIVYEAMGKATLARETKGLLLSVVSKPTILGWIRSYTHFARRLFP